MSTHPRSSAESWGTGGRVGCTPAWRRARCRNQSSASTYRQHEYSTNLDVNTQHQTLKWGNNFHMPLVLLSTQAHVEVMLCVQLSHREDLTVAQTQTARLRTAPTYQYLTAN